MKRYRQTLEEILALLSEVETSWMDEHSAAVIEVINAIPEKMAYTREDIAAIFNADFEGALTVVRLFLGLSRDEFEIAFRQALGQRGAGITRFRKDLDGFLAGIEKLGLPETIAGLVNKPVNWRDILIERLKYGRGSAIKGQKRGRSLENFTEAIVRTVFGDGNYDTRCRFIGATGLSTEKADFAIPNKQDSRILMEVKGYGATGSKQTDILGDIERIVNEKRLDTHLLLVTDGVTWRSRQSDLGKLIDWQNQGRIARIYTQRMALELEADLRQLRKDHSLDRMPRSNRKRRRPER
jgi:hypothetical protein